MPKYVAVHTLHMDGPKNSKLVIKPGEEFEATKEVADPLIASGAAKTPKQVSDDAEHATRLREAGIPGIVPGELPVNPADQPEHVADPDLADAKDRSGRRNRS